MKLTLDHLLKFPRYEDLELPGLLVQIGESIILPVTKSNLDFIIEKQYKPLLRPLSELKKKISKEKELPNWIKSELKSISSTKDYNLLSPNTKKALIKNLFDIDGLIEVGLALPYNFEWKKDTESLWVFD